MDAGGAGHDSSDDIQTQVFKTTLAEIETFRENPEDSAESRDCCVICLDSISDPCAALPCGHTHFDFLCLVSWLQQHPNCPLCKANVYKVRCADAQKTEAFYRVPNTPRTRDERDEGAVDQNTLLDTASRRRFTSHNGLLRETQRRGPRPPPTVDEAIQRRRDVYQYQLYSLHIGSNRISRYRPPPTPVQFATTPHLVSRARLWIRRELQAFSFLSEPPTTTNNTNNTNNTANTNAEFLLEYIIAILKTVDLQDSAGQAETMLADFLGGAAAARLFLHELRSWLRSPAAGLAAWDREVQYPAREARDRDRDRGRGRGSADEGVEEGGDDDDDRGGAGEDGLGGRSWRDRGGDHWRAGAYVGEGGKRKRREDEVGEGRVDRPRR
ncbi:uncharacterized protein B0H64DRAFT_420829 [Chaetomium fimeti]|uniref:RING-type E3 ubiquitin transferase n=1 Tax=Chaetomium fimeti TaxID=1854472 RepID=A0AAE0H639_9PEZI|nr:hypothetical protein B0H64DRAFT_420829 [Chaetomium fimeti]